MYCTERAKPHIAVKVIKAISRDIFSANSKNWVMNSSFR